MKMVLDEVATELARAQRKHPPIASAHEAYGILAEEFAELFDEIRRQQPDHAAMRREAIQVAAMAARFIVDVCDQAPAEEPDFDIFFLEYGPS